jgi:hypothetical protein
VTTAYLNTVRASPYKDKVKGDPIDLFTTSTVLQAPWKDPATGNYYVIPTDITVEADYEFYIFITSHGDPWGKEM